MFFPELPHPVLQDPGQEGPAPSHERLLRRVGCAAAWRLGQQEPHLPQRDQGSQGRQKEEGRGVGKQGQGRTGKSDAFSREKNEILVLKRN